MPHRSVLTALVLALVATQPLTAQATARGAVRLTVDRVMVVDVQEPGVAPRLAGDYYTAETAARVEVSANFAWTLVVAERGGGEPVASTDGAGAVVSPVWVRASAVDGRTQALAQGFSRTVDGVAVARGEAGGGMVVELDYRWLPGPDGAGSRVDLDFMVVPR